MLIKKSAIPEEWLINPFKENGADDGLLWMLMLLNGKKGILNEDKLYIHIYTGENTSLNTQKMMQSNFELVNALNGKLGWFQLFCIKRRAKYYGDFNASVLYKLRYLDVALIRKWYASQYYNYADIRQ